MNFKRGLYITLLRYDIVSVYLLNTLKKSGDPYYPVALYNLYKEHRPKEMLTIDLRFYVAVADK